MTTIINIVQKEQTEQTMTSLEIAELTGKNHFDLMRAIRNMEPAWEKVNGCKFALVEYRDKKGELRPCYQLTKTECLYIATKFNDEARAKLVLRWQELELQEQQRQQQLALPSPQQILARADEIIGEGLRLVNTAAEDTLTATQVAKTFNMTVFDFNHVLEDLGIQYRRYGRWNIADDLASRNLVRVRTHISYSLKGEKKVRHYMTWTLDGLRFLNAKLGYPNF
ncbi:MAG: Rha family transcriptional regulator [Prevotella sp.]|nr:Rha family transcriptional regulator [Prevotella sp.]